MRIEGILRKGPYLHVKVLHATHVAAEVVDGVAVPEEKAALYAKLSWGQKTAKTKAAKGTWSPQWNEGVELCIAASADEKLHVAVFQVVCVWVCVFGFLCVSVSLSLSLSVCVCVCVCVCVGVSVCVFVCMCLLRFVFSCLCFYVCLCVAACLPGPWCVPVCACVLFLLLLGHTPHCGGRV